MPAARSRTSQVNRTALAKMLRITGLGSMPDEAPLVALLRRLAKKLDEGGGTRDEAMYLSALKDARRVLDGAVARSKPPAGRSRVTVAQKKADAEAPAESAEPAAETDDLTAFKNKRGIA